MTGLGILIMLGGGAVAEAPAAEEEDYLKSDPITIPHASLLTLPTDPVPLLAGVAGKVIEVHRVSVLADSWNGSYGNVDSDAQLNVAYAGGGNGATNHLVNLSGATSALSDLFGADVSLAALAPVARVKQGATTYEHTQPAVYSASALAGLGLELTMDNGAAGDLTDGHADNNWKVVVYYDLRDVPAHAL